MFTSDVLGRVHPVASLQTLDRGSFQSLQEDVLDLSRVSESGAAVLSAHLLTWARSGEGRRHRAHHSSDERTGTHAPIGFASDHAPALDAHECIAGTCVRPFPPLLIESAIQRYSWTDVASERHQAALTLSELFIAQCAQMLHTMRFTAGRDLFAHDFLCDIDEIMRGAIWSGDAKGRKAAGEVLGIDIDTAATATTFDPASSPRLSPSGSAELKPTRPNYDRSSSVAASSAAATSASSHAAASTANLTAASSDRRSRRASQDSLIHHPFAPNAYDNATPSGAHTSRVIGGAHDGRGGRGLSRRILSTSAVAQRPRQCLVSSLLALLRFANGLGVRLKYWRGQLKAKQSEIARLTALAEAKQHEGEAATDAADPTADREVTTLRAKVDALESQLAVAHATLSEYESSGRVRHRYEPEFGDTSIPARPHIDVDGPLAGQVAALQLALDAARQENMTLIREGNDRLADHTSMRDAQHASLDALRAELAASRSEARAREEALAAVQSLADERELKVNQLGGMLAAIKERVTSREKEWEQREEAWKRGTTVRNDHEQDDDAAARAAAEYAAKEAAWFASQSARDDMEASLQAAATRAKQAHNSVLREYEELRRENVRVSAEVDAERKEMEARLKRCNASLSDARATIASLKAQLKKLQDERAMAVAAAVAAPAPPTTKPKDTTKEDRARIKREAAESLKQLELEMAAADAAAAEEKQRAAEAAAVAAAAAAERIKLAAAKLKKEKAARRKEAEAAAAAVAAAAAASQQVPPEEKKSRKKPRVAEAPPEDVKEVVQPPKMAPPTAQELAKPTPKLSSGYGRCVYEPGEWYEGWWVDYERSGDGTYQWRDGRRYTGSWLRDKKHGEGSYFWVDGDRYQGAYANDKMHGIGTYFFSDGTRYEGEWANDMSHGRGTFLYSDGAKYVGQFERDQKHGPGLMHLPTGEVFSEHWVGGKRISSVSVKQHQQQPQQPLYPQQSMPLPTPPQPQPPSSSKHLSRNIRLAAQEQLQMAMAMSARGPHTRR